MSECLVPKQTEIETVSQMSSSGGHHKTVMWHCLQQALFFLYVSPVSSSNESSSVPIQFSSVVWGLCRCSVSAARFSLPYLPLRRGSRLSSTALHHRVSQTTEQTISQPVGQSSPPSSRLPFSLLSSTIQPTN